MTYGMPDVSRQRRHDHTLQTPPGQCGAMGGILGGLFVSGIATFIGLIYYFNEGFSIWVLGFLAIFVLVGLVLIFMGFLQLLAQSRLRPPEVRLPVSPLFIGEQVTARFSQVPKRGVQVNSVKIKIVCRESATYTHGTNTSTVTHDVFTQEHVILENMAASPMQPLEAEFELAIPHEAMHTFAATHNKIMWLVETHTDVAGWPDYSQTLAFEVAPKRVEATATASE